MKFQIFSLFFFSLWYPYQGQAMIKALNTAAAGMVTQEEFVNTISNNIANSNTTGFKRSRPESEDLVYRTIIESGGSRDTDTRYSVGVQIGSGSRIAAVRKEFVDGSPMVTNRPWDLMVRGAGFFGIMHPDGKTFYTRDGSFNVDYKGNLVNRDGYKVFPGIQVPPNLLSVNITPVGEIEGYLSNQEDPENLGTLPIFTFMNSSGLKSVSGNLFAQTSGSGDPIQQEASRAGAGSILQGSLEMSNVSVMTEMTTLIQAQRAYETNSKVMGIADQMMETVNRIK